MIKILEVDNTIKSFIVKWINGNFSAHMKPYSGFDGGVVLITSPAPWKSFIAIGEIYSAETGQLLRPWIVLKNNVPLMYWDINLTKEDGIDYEEWIIIKEALLYHNPGIDNLLVLLEKRAF